jgi:hypothetical protein
VVERLGVSASLSGATSLVLAFPFFLNGSLVTGAFAAIMGIAFFATYFLSRAGRPMGRYLLIGYSVFLLLGFPVGTVQGIFQILHLTKPEARLIFDGRDRFSAVEARQIAAFRTANPWLAAWLRFINFLVVIAILGMAAAIGIPMLMK